jgi:hypothetical protein
VRVGVGRCKADNKVPMRRPSKHKARPYLCFRFYSERLWPNKRSQADLSLPSQTPKPQAASAWAASFPDAETRDQLFANVMNRWAKTDPSAVATWLQTLAADSSRDAAVAAFASRIVSANPQAAVEWAATISDATMRGHGDRSSRTGFGLRSTQRAPVRGSRTLVCLTKSKPASYRHID